jgi:hypothetical protein
MNLAFIPTVRLSLPSAWHEANEPLRETMRERTEVLHGLQRGQTMTLEQPAGHEVSCQRGRVCITLGADDTGHVLGTELCAGETYRPEGDGALRILALDDALIWSSSLGGIRAAVISRRS